MPRKLVSAVFASLLFTGLVSARAYADSVTFTLTAPLQTVAPGGTASYTATISAPGSNANPVFLNGDTFTFNGPGNITFTDDLFSNFPASVNPGETDTGVLFSASVPTGETPGVYTGSYVLQGGGDFNAQNNLGTQGFTLNVATASVVTPEPSSYLLLATGVSALAALGLRRRSVASQNVVFSS